MKRWGFVLAVAAVVCAPQIALAQTATFPPTTTTAPTPVPTTAPATTPAPTAGTLPNNGSPAQTFGFIGTSALEVGAGLMMWSAAQKARRRRKKDTNDRPPSAPEQLMPIPRVVVERPRVYTVTPVLAQLYKGEAPPAPKPKRTPTSATKRVDARTPGDWRRR